MKRLTFAGIEQKTHPLYQEYLQGVFECREKIDDRDEKIIQELLKAYLEYSYKTNCASGEWSWIQENKQQNYKRLLAEGNKEELVPLFRNLFRNEISFGISAPDIEDEQYKERLVNDILLDIDTWREFCGDLPVCELEIPNIGNPFGLMVDGSLVMYNSCRHSYHARLIKKLIKDETRPTILEIGGGYGGVFFFLNKILDNFCYIVCDLMETLFINYYFTSKWASFLGKEIKIKWALDGKITFEDQKNYQLILVPSTDHNNIDIGINLAYNSNSFSEMSKEDVWEYFDTIHKNHPKYIFHQNSNFNLWENSSRGHKEVLAKEFPISEEYELVYQAISPWTGAGGRYREYLYQKSTDFVKILE